MHYTIEMFTTVLLYVCALTLCARASATTHVPTVKVFHEYTFVEVDATTPLTSVATCVSSFSYINERTHTVTIATGAPYNVFYPLHVVTSPRHPLSTFAPGLHRSALNVTWPCVVDVTDAAAIAVGDAALYLTWTLVDAVDDTSPPSIDVAAATGYTAVDGVDVRDVHPYVKVFLVETRRDTANTLLCHTTFGYHNRLAHRVVEVSSDVDGASANVITPMAAFVGGSRYPPQRFEPGVHVRAYNATWLCGPDDGTTFAFAQWSLTTNGVQQHAVAVAVEREAPSRRPDAPSPTPPKPPPTTTSPPTSLPSPCTVLVRDLDIVQVSAFQTSEIILYVNGTTVEPESAFRVAPLIRNRTATIRVLVAQDPAVTLGGGVYVERPTVARFEFRVGGTAPFVLDELLDFRTISGAIALNDHRSTYAQRATFYEVVVPRSYMQHTELQMRVSLLERTDPALDTLTIGGDAVDARWPASTPVTSAPYQRLGATQFTEASGGVFRITLVSVETAGFTTNLSDAVVERYRRMLVATMPVVDIELTIHTEVMRVDVPTTPNDYPFAVLEAVSVLRDRDQPPSDVFYHAIFEGAGGINDYFVRYGSIVGVGLIGCVPTSTECRAAVSLGEFLDGSFRGSRITDGSAATVAHEHGHNCNRYHSPGCNAQTTPDQSPYPYLRFNRRFGTEGVIGHWTEDTSIDPPTFIAPGAASDYETYCDPAVTSDFTYRHVFDFGRAIWKHAAALGETSAVAADVDVRSIGDVEHVFATCVLIVHTNGTVLSVLKRRAMYPSRMFAARRQTLTLTFPDDIDVSVAASPSVSAYTSLTDKSVWFVYVVLDSDETSQRMDAMRSSTRCIMHGLSMHAYHVATDALSPTSTPSTVDRVGSVESQSMHRDTSRLVHTAALSDDVSSSPPYIQCARQCDDTVSTCNVTAAEPDVAARATSSVRVLGIDCPSHDTPAVEVPPAQLPSAPLQVLRFRDAVNMPPRRIVTIERATLRLWDATADDAFTLLAKRHIDSVPSFTGADASFEPAANIMTSATTDMQFFVFVVDDANLRALLVWRVVNDSFTLVHDGPRFESHASPNDDTYTRLNTAVYVPAMDLVVAGTDVVTSMTPANLTDGRPALLRYTLSTDTVVYDVNVFGGARADASLSSSSSPQNYTDAAVTSIAYDHVRHYVYAIVRLPYHSTGVDFGDLVVYHADSTHSYTLVDTFDASTLNAGRVHPLTGLFNVVVRTDPRVEEPDNLVFMTSFHVQFGMRPSAGNLSSVVENANAVVASSSAFTVAFIRHQDNVDSSAIVTVPGIPVRMHAGVAEFGVPTNSIVDVPIHIEYTDVDTGRLHAIDLVWMFHSPTLVDLAAVANDSGANIRLEHIDPTCGIANAARVIDTAADVSLFGRTWSSADAAINLTVVNVFDDAVDSTVYARTYTKRFRIDTIDDFDARRPSFMPIAEPSTGVLAEQTQLCENTTILRATLDVCTAACGAPFTPGCIVREIAGRTECGDGLVALPSYCRMCVTTYLDGLVESVAVDDVVDVCSPLPCHLTPTIDDATTSRYDDVFDACSSCLSRDNVTTRNVTDAYACMGDASLHAAETMVQCADAFAKRLAPACRVCLESAASSATTTIADVADVFCDPTNGSGRIPTCTETATDAYMQHMNSQCKSCLDVRPALLSRCLRDIAFSGSTCNADLYELGKGASALDCVGCYSMLGTTRPTLRDTIEECTGRLLPPR